VGGVIIIDDKSIDNTQKKRGTTREHQYNHTVEYDPFMKRQLTSRNQLEGLLWGKLGHVTPRFMQERNPRTPPCGEGERGGIQRKKSNEEGNGGTLSSGLERIIRGKPEGEARNLLVFGELDDCGEQRLPEAVHANHLQPRERH
jgi:hypothetical protein